MILTNCAACAAPLALDAPRCVRCQTRTVYARTLYFDPTATLDDLREAVTTLEETELLARRVLGGVHPFAAEIEKYLRESRAALRDRESGDVESIREAVVRWWRR